MRYSLRYKNVPLVEQVGHGVVQVDACFEHLRARAAVWTDDVRYELSVSAPGHA
jgi:hypothetical protein